MNYYLINYATSYLYVYFVCRLRRELNRQLRQQRNHIKSVIYDTDVIIDDLKTQVEVLNSCINNFSVTQINALNTHC